MLYFDQGTDGFSYKLVAQGILQKFYTVIDLTPGVTYKFRVRSRNSIGSS
jgi:hypothetical protein